MFAVTRSTRGRVAQAVLVTLPFATLACGKDSGVRVAEARTPDTTPVTTPTIEMAPTVVTGVLTDASVSDGDAAYKAGKFKDAATLFKVRTKSHVTDAYAFYMLGLSSWKSGDFAGAKSAFDKAIELDTTFSKSYFNAGRNLLDMGRAPEALEIIVKGLTVDSTSPDGWRLKARAESEQGDVAAAFTTYRTMLLRDEGDAWGLNNFGMFLLAHDCPVDALGPLARAVLVRPTAPLFRNNLGMALEKSGYKVAALRQYEQAVRDDSTFTKAVKNATRLRALVTDSSAVEEIGLSDLAEKFRLKVKEWRTPQ